MSNSIAWDTIVGKSTVDDGGYIGSLLTLSRAHLVDARDKGQLTDSQVGEVYSSLIPSAIQAGISFGFEKKTKEYEADIAEIKVKTADVEKLITDEKYITAQEQNGKISYSYVYKYTYSDYAGVQHYLNPNKVDPTTNKIIQGYVDSFGIDTEYVGATEVFDQYKNGDGTWSVVNTVSINRPYSIVVNNCSITLSNGSKVETNVSAYEYNKLADKECYVFRNSVGETICVEVGSDTNIGTSNSLSTAMTALLQVSGVNRTSAQWDDLYTNGSTDLTDRYKRVIFADKTNHYNIAGMSISEAGWDGTGTAPKYGMQNSKKELQYQIAIDYSTVFSREVSDTVQAGDDSLVQLEKKKLLNDIALANKQLELGKIPSTLK